MSTIPMVEERGVATAGVCERGAVTVDADADALSRRNVNALGDAHRQSHKSPALLNVVGSNMEASGVSAEAPQEVGAEADEGSLPCAPPSGFDAERFMDGLTVRVQDDDEFAWLLDQRTRATVSAAPLPCVNKDVLGRDDNASGLSQTNLALKFVQPGEGQRVGELRVRDGDEERGSESISMESASKRAKRANASASEVIDLDMDCDPVRGCVDDESAGDWDGIIDDAEDENGEDEFEESIATSDAEDMVDDAGGRADAHDKDSSSDLEIVDCVIASAQTPPPAPGLGLHGDESDIEIVSPLEMSSKKSPLFALMNVDSRNTLKLKVELMKHQKVAVEWMHQRELGSFPRGGILADDQGLGKTVSTLGLVAATHTGQQGPTLIVCPLAVLPQWSMEIESKLEGRPRRVLTLTFHGPERKHFTMQRLRKADFVLTTYSTLASEWGDDGGQSSRLYHMKWCRIILDEAQSIKNRLTKYAKACFNVKAAHRWCLTGTPLQNNVDDLWSLLHFLRVEIPDAVSFAEWKRNYHALFESADMRFRLHGIRKVQHLLGPICLRRSKSDKDPETGLPILNLPPREVRVVSVDFGDEEREFYERLRSRNDYAKLMKKGAEYIRHNYAHVLVMLLNLRQACCHPWLVADRYRGISKDKRIEIEARLADGSAFLHRFADSSAQAAFLSRYGESLLFSYEENIACSACSRRVSFESQGIDFTAEDVGRVTPCGHLLCTSCVRNGAMHVGSACADCQAPVVHGHTATLPLHALRDEVMVFSDMNKAASGANGAAAREDEDLGSRGKNLRSVVSAKTRALIADLQNAEQGTKSLVFSQWTSFLDLLRPALDAAHIPYCLIVGSMSLTEREKAIRIFKSGPIPVMLLSLKACGAGLNLVEASRVYLLDSWWNPAVEEQAIDRTHRIGQKQRVEVVKFKVQSTVEDKIISLQERKRSVMLGVMDNKVSDGRGNNALSVDDLVFLLDAQGREEQGRSSFFE
ncbi:putative SWI/SNF-related matrix-associated actin-dependent regulator [Porphyridium purpureum]|uniref:Putative SWI/SNF-related matrix-associated actin-dependent regulator n=1 Tax=Porphyridium purpureum TaxID=35688 RepID=A0A5J4YM93_PORPP|nr:putative SWI/SNF-related matrix-associated actin-dependent regulator [Porphyridium purpureum]|eukprot:POR2991..scf249_10